LAEKGAFTTSQFFELEVKAKVPDVIGMTKSEAEQQIRMRSLVPLELEPMTTFFRDPADGTVANQLLEPGTRLKVGEKVRYRLYAARSEAASLGSSLHDCPVPGGAEPREIGKREVYYFIKIGDQERKVGPHLKWWDDNRNKPKLFKCYNIFGELNGDVKYWIRKGKIKILDKYLHGKKHGVCERYYESSGEIKSRVNFRNGKYHGRYETFDEEGNPLLLRKYNDGKLEKEVRY
jgi:hypothetical protein